MTGAAKTGAKRAGSARGAAKPNGRAKAKRGRGDTQKRMTSADVDRFLGAVEEGATAREAATIAGFSRNSFYELSTRDGGFRQRWNKARERGNALLLDEAEEAARTRSVDGWLEPVFHKGKPVGARRKFSDGLLSIRLKALAPKKYRERLEVDGQARIELHCDPGFLSFCEIVVDAVKAFPEAQAALIDALSAWEAKHGRDAEPLQ